MYGELYPAIAGYMASKYPQEGCGLIYRRKPTQKGLSDEKRANSL